MFATLSPNVKEAHHGPLLLKKINISWTVSKNDETFIVLFATSESTKLILWALQ